MERARPALWAAALAVLALLSGPPPARAGAGTGPVVRCEPCDARALEQCAPPPAAPACAELVREPGCGCCMTCALREGEPCGVYTERCGAGLRCQPPRGEPRPLQSLLDGRGLCTNSSALGRLRAYLLHGPSASGNASESEEEHSAGSTENQELPSTHRVPDSKFHTLHTKIDVIKKGHAKDSQRYKVDYESQSTDTQNFSSESKQETEYGPCRREMEDTLNHLKFLNVLSPRGVHIPNCDKKGFYKKKQCRPSKGRKRGFCWCVDKYGQPLPGYDTKGKGDIHCYNMESK
ncbi:insulin-like growth factor-binding protein 3 [Loxodonta africana]|uniref:insulin-like growth factor-binding protein 3 n=1 Tax=Loxodonta africana TaxID=9785 RepID=UPI0002233C04|nr:insulin-like growth factor-binding protein 3 [Loxodonta africana]XP_049750240.1 insulin-like growth factor-binding protein 3 [Elephas maximus indicus]